MLQKINMLKFRFSFFLMQIISILASPFTIQTLIGNDIGYFYLFTAFLIISGLFALVIILYIFELIFPNFRIPSKITESKVYQIVFFLGCIILLINLLAFVLSIVDDIFKEIIFTINTK